MAGGGQANARGQSLQQRAAQLLLEAFDLLRERSRAGRMRPSAIIGSSVWYASACCSGVDANRENPAMLARFHTRSVIETPVLGPAT